MPFGRIALDAKRRCRRDLQLDGGAPAGDTRSSTPPYAPAIVTLDEGYQMLTNIVGVAPADLAIGMRVRVQFHAVSDEVTLPYFTARS